MLTIADDLIILAVGLKPRVGPNNGLLSPRFADAVRGAELIALASAGRVEVSGDVIQVRDSTPLGDPALDAALAAAGTGAAVRVRAWMDAAPSGFVSARFERLAEAGLLRGERYMLLLIAPRTAYRLADERAARRYDQLRARLHAAVTAAQPLDVDELALVGLVQAGDIARLAYPGSAGAPARARIAELAAGQSAVLVQDARQPSTVPDTTLSPSLLFPTVPGSTDQHHHHPPTSDPARPHVQAAVSAAVHAAVAASTAAAVAATVEASHHHTSGGSGSSDSSPSHHHH